MHGQLLFREWFYLMAHCETGKFHQMVGNKNCKQVPWSMDEDLLAKWEAGQTGFPAIDATMR